MLEMAAFMIAWLSEVVFDSVTSNNRNVLLAGKRPKRASTPPKKVSLLNTPQSSVKVERSKGFASACGADATAMLARLMKETAASAKFRNVKRLEGSVNIGGNWGFKYGDSTHLSKACQRNFQNYRGKVIHYNFPSKK